MLATVPVKSSFGSIGMMCSTGMLCVNYRTCEVKLWQYWHDVFDRDVVC